MLKNQLKLKVVFLLMGSIVYFTSTEASDFPYYGAFPGQGFVVNTARQRAAPQQMQWRLTYALPDFMSYVNPLFDNLLDLQNINNLDAQRILRGLLQFIINKGYLELKDTIRDRTLWPKLLTALISINKNLYFREYIARQPGATIREQLERALQNLEALFAAQLPQIRQDVTNNPAAFGVISDLIDLLRNLPQYLHAISNKRKYNFRDFYSLLFALTAKLEQKKSTGLIVPDEDEGEEVTMQEDKSEDNLDDSNESDSEL